MADGFAELLVRFEVGQGSADLYASFEAQVALNLDANAIIRHPGFAELDGNAEIQQETSVELYGVADIRQPAENLYCEFRVSSDLWITQGVSAEAYIALSIVV